MILSDVTATAAAVRCCSS